MDAAKGKGWIRAWRGGVKGGGEMAGSRGVGAVGVTGEGADVGWVGTEMMEGAAYVEGGKTGGGAEAATGE